MNRGAWQAIQSMGSQRVTHDWEANTFYLGFSGGSDDKAFTCNVGDLGSIPGSGRSPGEGHGNPFQYSCLENSMGRGAWQATVHGFANSQTQLSNTIQQHNNIVLKIMPGKK